MTNNNYLNLFSDYKTKKCGLGNGEYIFTPVAGGVLYIKGNAHSSSVILGSGGPGVDSRSTVYEQAYILAQTSHLFTPKSNFHRQVT